MSAIDFKFYVVFYSVEKSALENTFLCSPQWQRHTLGVSYIVNILRKILQMSGHLVLAMTL